MRSLCPHLGVFQTLPWGSSRPNELERQLLPGGGGVVTFPKLLKLLCLGGSHLPHVTRDRKAARGIWDSLFGKRNPMLVISEAPLEICHLKPNAVPFWFQHGPLPVVSSGNKQLITFQGSKSPPGTPRSCWHLSSHPRWKSGRADGCQGLGCAGQLAFCRESKIQVVAYTRTLHI